MVNFATRFNIIAWLFVFFSQTPLAHASNIKLKTDKGAPVLVSGQNYSGDSEAHLTELTGQVSVIFNEQSISCDHAIIHDLTSEIEADGHLIIDSPTVHIEGQSAKLNYKTNLGTIENGFIMSGQVMFEGEHIIKTGPDQYIAERGYYTACTTCPPAWSFRAKEIDAQLGGYARLKSVLFEVMHFPILWLPYLIVPLKSDRQSGFLIPQVTLNPATNEGKGFQLGFSESYFWAIDRSQDATLTFKSTPSKGFKTNGNYRYLLGDNSGGSLDVSALRDKQFNGDKLHLYPDKDPSLYDNLPSLPNSFTRWFLHYGHHYQLPEEITQNTQLNLLSDFRYPYDYPDDFPIYGGERALESRFTIAKNTELTHSSLDASYYLNILKSDPLNGRKGSLLSGNGDAIHRAPELRYSIVNSQIENTGILVHSDVNYVHFARQDFAYDDIIQETCQPGTCIDPTRGNSPGHVGTGQFDPQRDALRTGDRFDFQPEFSYPFQIGKIFDIVPAVSYRFTQYNFDVSPDNPSQTPSFAEDPQVIGYNTHPTRSYFKESLSTRTRFGKVWGTDPTNPKEIKYKHEFIPEIMLSTLSGMNETQSAFFGKNDSTPAFLIDQPITDSEIFDPVHRKPLQFDYNDRVVNRNVLTGVLTNKIVRKSWKGAPTASNNPDLKANKITDADEAEYLQVVGVKVWQSYDFDAATATPQFPWSDIDALLDFRFNHFESNLLLRYFPYHNVTNSSIRSRIYDSLNNFLQVTYNQSFLITENLNDVTTGPNPHSESIGLGAGIVRRYFKLFGDINITPRDFKDNYFINVWNAQLNITPPGNCWGVGLHFVHAYNGDGTQSTISFDYQFGGGTPTPINTSSEAPANPLNNPINNPANTGAKI